MKTELPPELEKGRERNGLFASDPGDGWNGRFFLRHPKTGKLFLLFVSNGLGWEHVSVSLPHEKRCPTWDEMCWVKSLCWQPGETVVQYHPAEEDYVDLHPYVLHLFRPLEQELPRPDPTMIGWGRKRSR
jgi:hypothetical protein